MLRFRALFEYIESGAKKNLLNGICNITQQQGRPVHFS